MIRFPKAITPEFFEYTTHLSADETKTTIGKLIDESKVLNNPANLAGEYINDGEYTITSQWQIGPMITGLLAPFVVTTPTTLKVFVCENKKLKTQVNLLVSPNSYYPLLFVFLPISLLIYLGMLIQEALFVEACLIVIPLLLICPWAILKISSF